MATALTVKNINPLPGYILVEPAEPETKTDSGIYLPSNSEEKPQHGSVVACGDTAQIDGQEVKCPVKKGDQVIYKKWGGNEIKVADKELQLLKFEDVLATVK
jgi:chaperonin GroES